MSILKPFNCPSVDRPEPPPLPPDDEPEIETLQSEGPVLGNLINPIHLAECHAQSERVGVQRTGDMDNDDDIHASPPEVGRLGMESEWPMRND